MLVKSQTPAYPIAEPLPALARGVDLLSEGADSATVLFGPPYHRRRQQQQRRYGAPAPEAGGLEEGQGAAAPGQPAQGITSTLHPGFSSWNAAFVQSNPEGRGQLGDDATSPPAPVWGVPPRCGGLELSVFMVVIISRTQGSCAYKVCCL